ncbi:type IV pilus biogenesis/stability protein PilW [Ideonella margarita]|uniref:Type IV pilus biogenesis/stability protein PilW n=1 Tax=Ideonella margarita TaxID=2984191 RepID=A0ABU9C324_9BURK
MHNRRLVQVVCGPMVALLLLAAGSLSGCAGPARSELNQVQTASDQTDLDRRARVRLELASAYFSRGQYNTALDEVKLALQARSDLSDAFNLRGLIYGAMEEPALAEESFKRALQLNPRDGDAMHNMAWFQCQQRRYAEADATFERVLALPAYRETQRSLMARGHCQARNAQWPEAERTLSRAYELDAGNPAAAVSLSEVLYQRGEYERARFYIRRVNAAEEYLNAQTLWLAIRIENKMGQPAQVRALGVQLTNRFPQAPEALLYQKGRFDD